MYSENKKFNSDTFWLVRDLASPEYDETSTFVENGTWENRHERKYDSLINSVLVGDKIALQWSHKNMQDSPFAKYGEHIPAMEICAVGTVKHNPGDGKNLKVDWQSCDPTRKWCFSNSWRTITRIQSDTQGGDALINFIFKNQMQDVDSFKNSPSIRERYSDWDLYRSRFTWIGFYEEIANKLLRFRNRPEFLISGIHKIASKIDCFTDFHDRFADSSTGPLQDICPFTVMSIFNRETIDRDRQWIAGELAALLGVTTPVPDSFPFEVIPNNQDLRFFSYAKNRHPDEITNLWDVFSSAIAFADFDKIDSPDTFINLYNKAIQQDGVVRNITKGLYWARPWTFLALDSHSQDYIRTRLGIDDEYNNPESYHLADNYLNLIDSVKYCFQHEDSPSHAFPELSLDVQLQIRDQLSQRRKLRRHMPLISSETQLPHATSRKSA